MNNQALAVQFFLQLAFILAVCRIVGLIAKRFGQPQVVAEMIAGVMMGPSLFGQWFPEWQAGLFPWDRTQQTRDSQSYLFPLSQLGLALYMFIVGLEFRMDIIKEKFKSSLMVSLAGMITPFVLGGGLGYYFHQHTSLFPVGVKVEHAMIFLGASMCITAFPMLARIIHFKGLTGTTMGTVAIGAGAIDDAAAWALLALVLSAFKGDLQSAYECILGGLGFVILAHLILKPLLKIVLASAEKHRRLSENQLVICLALMALGAWWTDKIELHAVFGAFVMGSIMPRGVVTHFLIEKMQPLAVGLLLPLFFTYSGLNTEIGLITDWKYILPTLLVLICAIFGKGIACWGAAILSGISSREALGIGVLMNARGLMELIIINKGLEKKIISKELFAMLAIMAIVTTLMASPLFEHLIAKKIKSKK
jgi:Kef-type K+ transport system membrane component KefB